MSFPGSDNSLSIPDFQVFHPTNAVKVLQLWTLTD